MAVILSDGKENSSYYMNNICLSLSILVYVLYCHLWGMFPTLHPLSWYLPAGYDAVEKDVIGVIIKCCDSACGQEEQDKEVQW